MSAAGLADSAELTPIEARIAEDAQRFDLGPLVDLLLTNGYARDDILFESAAEGRSASIVRAVRFHKQPIRSVVITVQVGLLGDNSLLPSYFFHLMERSRDPDRFLDFLRFFDHRLIDNLFRALYPERSGVYVSWISVLASFLRMAMPASISTLHWLVQLYFPELRVRVTRRPFASATDSYACRTGLSLLDGTGILGRTYVAEVTGFLVDLIAEDEIDMSGRSYSDIVQARLKERLLPLLDPFRLPLMVRLTVLAHASWAQVDEPRAAEQGYLGYDRLRGMGEARHVTVMYHGVTGEPAPARRR